MPLRCVLVLLTSAMAMSRAEAQTPGDQPTDQPAAASAPTEEDPAWFEALSYQHQSAVSVLATQGLSTHAGTFKPGRSLRLSDQSKLILGRNSLVWHLRLELERHALSGGPATDEAFTDQTVTLPNGSVIGKDRAFIVQEAYVQHLREQLLVQVGSQLFAWGSADSVNPTSVVNPQDLRSGFLGDKETKITAIPAVRLALLGEGQTLNFIYAPWRRASLLPGPEQNWYLAPDNLSFNVQVTPSRQVESRGSYAIKYDKTIAEGDLSFLYYQGADYDIQTVPKELLVINNQPLTVNMMQITPDKTTYGASYSQTFGKWVLKTEGAFTPNKLALPEVDRSRIQDVRFPIDLHKTGYAQATAGFNYFAPVTQFFGLPLDGTVLTAEYYKAQYTKKEVSAPTLSDLIIANLRTTAMEERLEIYFTYGFDPAKQGRTWSGKLAFNGETLRHRLVYAGFAGKEPEANQNGSIFYYWRNNHLLSYELTYPF